VIKVKSTLGRLAACAAVVALVATVEAAFGVAQSDTEPPGPAGKDIEPMAASANPKRYSDQAKTGKMVWTKLQQRARPRL
jgi:hypothetical protein